MYFTDESIYNKFTGKYSITKSVQEAHKLETDRLSSQILDLRAKNQELEAELKAAFEVNSELRATVNEAEAVCIGETDEFLS